jgi:N-methylhydantoinase A
MSDLLLGIDVGGTFTDVVLADADGLFVESSKTLTTVTEPADGCLEGVEKVLAASGRRAGDVIRVVHATTLATNLLLERKGSEVAYVTTRGFADIPRIGRELRTRESVYDLFYEKPLLPVDRELCFGLSERVGARGEVLAALEEAELTQLGCALEGSRAKAVALCLLNSYANPRHEQQAASWLRDRFPDLYVAVSTEVSPVMREYDRAATTIISAYVGPVVGAYFDRLAARLRSRGMQPMLEIMRADGGIIDVQEAVRRAVLCLESGPAAGVTAAGFISAECFGGRDLIAFDMGGTTAKAGLVRSGRPLLSNELHVGGALSSAARNASSFPLKVASIDLSEVGSGGGSIAWVDEGGLLRVGPSSAGASPGPACYGRGGSEPTVTDADLVLGYIDPAASLGDGSPVSLELAGAAIRAKIATPLGLDVLTAARGIHDISNAMMAGAIRNVTVERGIDPRDFVLCGSGGAGPVHVVQLAAEFGIGTIIVPSLAGVLSSLGMLTSDRSYEVARSHPLAVSAAKASEVESIFDQLRVQALEEYGLDDASVATRPWRSVDARFRHQTQEITVALDEGGADSFEPDRIAERFFSTYEELFGVRRREPVELVNFRLRLAVETRKPVLVSVASGATASEQSGVRDVYSPEDGVLRPTPVYRRSGLAVGDPVSGPTVVSDGQTSLVVPPRYQVQVDRWHNLVVEVQRDSRMYDQAEGAASRGSVESGGPVRVPPLSELLRAPSTSRREGF